MSASADRKGGGVAAPSRIFVIAFTALRIFTGLVWLPNGLAKLTDKGAMTGDSSRSTSSPAALHTPSPKVPRRRHPSLRWATSTNRSCYRIGESSVHSSRWPNWR